MGDKKKKDKDRKKHRRKSKEKDRNKRRKSKSERRYSSSSEESRSYESQSPSRSRSRDKKNKRKDKKKSKDKSKATDESKPTMPFDFTSKPPTGPAFNPIAGIKGAMGNLAMMPPPAPPSTTPTTILKSKNKEINIFKLFPKLPAGPVTLARTIYSSKLLSRDFEIEEFKKMSEELEKSARSEGSKRGASIMSKCKLEIEKYANEKKQQIMKDEIYGAETENQFIKMKKIYQAALEAPKIMTQ